MKARGKVIAGLMIAVTAGALVLACAWLAIPVYLESVISGLIHERVSQMAGVQASVKSVDVDLWCRKVELYGFRISQPPGFSDGDLLYAAESEVSFRMPNGFSGALELSDVRIVKAMVDVRTDTNGLSNVQALVNKLRSSPEGGESGEREGQSLIVNSLTAVDCVVKYHETTASSNTVEFAVVDIAVDVSNLRYTAGGGGATVQCGMQTSAVTNSPGRLTATGRLRKRMFPDGMCGVVVEMGTVGGEFPLQKGALRVVGLELAVLEEFLPAKTAAIIGGNAVDFMVDFSCVDGSLTGEAVIDTIAGYSYDATISGTPAAPVWQTDSDALAYVISRSRGGLINTLRNIRTAGGGAVSDVTGAAADLAEGTLKTVGSFSHGLAETAKGIVTLDSSGISLGSKKMGAALTGDAKDTVVGAGGSIVKGVGNISDSLTGGKTAEKWRAEVPVRWTNVWQDAINYIESDLQEREEGE